MSKFEIPKKIFEIIKSFPDKSRALIVGGAVRDYFLNKKIKDFDIEVYGLNLENLKEHLSKFGLVKQVGKSFGVLKITGIDTDWSLPRQDSSGRHPKVKINSNLSYKEAFLRRDLTINAIGYNPLTEQFIDCFEGIKDIKDRTLRAVSLEKFSEDPLRVLRVMQFISRFEMKPDEALTSLCSKIDLKDISSMRYKDEFDKLLKTKRPSLGLIWLYNIGQLEKILFNFQDNNKIKKETIIKALKVIDEVSEKTMSLVFETRKILIWAAFFSCLYINSEEQLYIALLKITNSKVVSKKIIKLLFYTSKLESILSSIYTDIDLKQFAYEIKPITFYEIIIIIEAKHNFLNNYKSDFNILCLKNRLRKLDIEKTYIKPILDGYDLLKIGFNPEDIGKFLKIAYLEQLSNKKNSKKDLLTFIKGYKQIKS